MKTYITATSTKINEESLAHLLRSNDTSNFDQKQLNEFLLLSARIANLEGINFLLEKGADIEARNSKGNTPILEAAFNLKETNEAVKILVEKKANIHVLDNNRLNLLHYAVAAGDLELVKLLLEHSIDINHKSEQGYTPLVYLVLLPTQHLKEFSESFAEFRSVTTDVKIAELLISMGAKVNLTVDNQSPFIFEAIAKGEPNLAKLLINSGANLGYVNKNHFDAINFAAQRGNVEIIKLLISKGLNCYENGRLAFVAAAKNNHIDAFKYLLSQGNDHIFYLEEMELDESCRQEFHDWLEISHIIRNLVTFQKREENIDVLNIVDMKELIEFAKNSMTFCMKNVGVKNNYTNRLKEEYSNLPPQLLKAMLYQYEELMNSSKILPAFETSIIAHQEGISPVPYVMLIDRKGDSKTVEIEKALNFYEENPLYKTPGNYLLMLIKNISDVSGICALNEIMLRSSIAANAVFNLNKGEVLPMKLKQKIYDVIENHKKYIENTELLIACEIKPQEVFNGYTENVELSGEYYDDSGNILEDYKYCSIM